MRRMILAVMFGLASIASFSEVVRDIIKLDETYTDSTFIMRQLSFMQNQSVSKSDLDMSILNLKRTELFGIVEMAAIKVDSGMYEPIENEILSASTECDTIDIELTTKEMLVLLPSIGYSNASPRYMMLGASYGNLWKIRHKVEITFAFGEIQEAALEYSVPSVYSRRYMGRTKILFNKKIRKLLELKETHLNGLLGIGWSLNPNNVPQIAVGYDRVSFENDSISLSYLENNGIGYDEYLYLEGRITSDYRNDPYYPTGGFFTEFIFTNDINNWSTEINRYIFTGDTTIFAPVPFGVLAMRNKLTLQNGTLAYYDNVEPDNAENRAISDKDLVALNRYTGNVEYRYTIPYRYKIDYPVIGSISINYMIALFCDWTNTASDKDSMSLFDSSQYKYGYGIGFRMYSELFSALGVDVGFSPQNGYDDIFKKLKYNILLVSWNF